MCVDERSLNIFLALANCQANRPLAVSFDGEKRGASLILDWRVRL
jgi:hypothetical protein